MVTHPSFEADAASRAISVDEAETRTVVARNLRRWLLSGVLTPSVQVFALAESSGLSPTTIRRIARGQNDFSLDTLARLSHATGIHVTRLMVDLNE
jgi:transcriptional regulator with XRE-family HTH domain